MEKCIQMYKDTFNKIQQYHNDIFEDNYNHKAHVKKINTFINTKNNSNKSQLNHLNKQPIKLIIDPSIICSSTPFTDSMPIKNQSLSSVSSQEILQRSGKEDQEREVTRDLARPYKNPKQLDAGRTYGNTSYYENKGYESDSIVDIQSARLKKLEEQLQKTNPLSLYKQQEYSAEEIENTIVKEVRGKKAIQIAENVYVINQTVIQQAQTLKQKEKCLVINPALPSLEKHKGVCQEIWDAATKGNLTLEERLKNQCNKNLEQKKGKVLPAGEVIVTEGFKLSHKIAHAVSPCLNTEYDFHEYDKLNTVPGKEDLLANLTNSYFQALNYFTDNRKHTVVSPILGTELFNIDPYDSLVTAVGASKEKKTRGATNVSLYIAYGNDTPKGEEYTDIEIALAKKIIDYKNESHLR